MANEKLDAVEIRLAEIQMSLSAGATMSQALWQEVDAGVRALVGGERVDKWSDIDAVRDILDMHGWHCYSCCMHAVGVSPDACQGNQRDGTRFNCYPVGSPARAAWETLKDGGFLSTVAAGKAGILADARNLMLTGSLAFSFFEPDGKGAAQWGFRRKDVKEDNNE